MARNCSQGMTPSRSLRRVSQWSLPFSSTDPLEGPVSKGKRRFTSILFTALVAPICMQEISPGTLLFETDLTINQIR